MLRFIGIDPDTNGAQCPAVWADTDADEIVVQGWRAGDALLAKTQADSPLAPNEGVVRVPARMIPLLREACDAFDRIHA